MSVTEVKSRRNFLIPLLVILVIIAVVVIGIVVYKYEKSHAKTSASTTSDVSSLTAQVGKLIELPTGEEPTIATVSDKSKLASQPFFANAEDGDKVLIYTKAQEAFLYRPSVNKLINVAQINLGTSPTPAVSGLPAPSSSATPTPAAKTYKVIIYNGTTVVGLAKTTQTALESKVSNVNVIALHDAVKSDYTKTLVVDLKGGNNAEAQSIATALNGSVGPLPAGENKPSGTDIIIIVGQ